MWQRPVGRLPIVAEISALTLVGLDSAALSASCGLRLSMGHVASLSCPLRHLRAFAGRPHDVVRYNARVSRSAVAPRSHQSEAPMMLSRCGVLHGAVIMSGKGLGRVPPSR
jgi:hypothetical protein